MVRNQLVILSGFMPAGLERYITRFYFTINEAQARQQFADEGGLVSSCHAIPYNDMVESRLTLSGMQYTSDVPNPTDAPAHQP